MKGCQQTLAVLVALGLVGTAVLALFVVNLAQVVTDRERIKAVLDVEQILRQTGPEMLLSGLQMPPAIEALIPDNVNLAAVQAAFDELIPPDWLNQQGDRAVDDIYDFLETGQTNQISSTEVDLRPVLQRLRAEPGRHLIEATLSALPPCSEPIPPFDIASLQLPDCRPVQIPVTQVADLVHTAVVQTLDANPQLLDQEAIIRVPLLTQSTLSPEAWQNLQRAHQLFVLAQNWAWLLWLPPLACLLLLLLLIIRSLGQLGHWWGWPLLISGVLSFFIAILLPAVALAQLRQSLPTTLGTLQPSATRIIQELADQLITLWLNRVYLQAGLMLGAGIILVGIGFLFHRRSPSPTYP